MADTNVIPYFVFLQGGDDGKILLIQPQQNKMIFCQTQWLQADRYIATWHFAF